MARKEKMWLSSWASSHLSVRDWHLLRCQISYSVLTSERLIWDFCTVWGEAFHLGAFSCFCNNMERLAKNRSLCVASATQLLRRHPALEHAHSCIAFKVAPCCEALGCNFSWFKGCTERLCDTWGLLGFFFGHSRWYFLLQWYFGACSEAKTIESTAAVYFRSGTCFWSWSSS